METQAEPFRPCGWVFWIKFVDWVGQKMRKSKIGHSLRGEGVKVQSINMQKSVFFITGMNNLETFVHF